MAGLKALLAADVVISDLLAPRALLAWLAPSVAEIDVAKAPRSRFTAQEEINALLVLLGVSLLHPRRWTSRCGSCRPQVT